MHYKDLTPYEHSTNHGPVPFSIPEVLNVGWLEKGYDFRTGSISNAIVTKLAQLLTSEKTHILLTRGIHHCDFCDSPESWRDRKVEVYGGEKYALGSAQIWVPAPHGDTIFAAPDLIHHYITQHNYCPPTEFLNAVTSFDITSNWDGTAIYKNLVDKYRKPLVEEYLKRHK